MKIEHETVTLNGVEYVKKDSLTSAQKAETLDGMSYVILRTYSAGVFAGFLKSRNGQEAVLLNARRLWKWSGAASLSQLAVDGTSNPKDCMFPCEVPKIELTQVIEILEVSDKAKKSIASVEVWKK